MAIEKQNIPILNLLRAIASIGVCAIHMHFLADLYDKPIHDLLRYGQYGVSIFFVISGFVIPYSLWNGNYQINDFLSFISKRLVRIGIPFSIIVIISATLQPNFSSLRFICNLFYLVPFTKEEWYQPIFWTLAVEFQFYILIGLTLPFLQNLKIKLLLPILLILASICFRFPHSKESSFLILNIHFFIFGILALLIIKNKLSKRYGHFSLFILSVILSYSVSFTVGFVGYITALAIIFVNFRTVFTDFLGKISYSLYLTHFLTGSIFAVLLNPVISNRYLLFLTLLLFCLSSAIVFYTLVEKYALKFSKRTQLKMFFKVK